jgi:tripartite-type tricarboxylate transporter receptor subunit TctC
MQITRRWLTILGMITMMPVGAQSVYPQKPIKIVVPFAAGGSTDVMARLVGQKMAEALGQTVLIDNRPGAGGAIASDAVAKSPADGHTLLMATTSTHAILPVANPKLPYDVQRDFVAVGLVAKAPNVLVVSPALGVSDVKGLMDVARAQPGKLSFASSGNGTITHLVSEAFNKAAGIQAIHVPYKTGVQALSDMVSGGIAYQFDSITWTLPQVKAGKIKALAISSLKRSPLAPDLPTVSESGLPGFEGLTWFGFVTPSAMPGDALQKLSKALEWALQQDDVQTKLVALGAEPASGQASELQTLMRQDALKWGRVIKEAGVKFE